MTLFLKSAVRRLFVQPSVITCLKCRLSTEPMVTIRAATMDDYPAVMAISTDVYNGRDYLPSKYEELLTSSHCQSYVTIMNNEIVGFGATSTVDGGETMVMVAGRVKKILRGSNVTSSVIKFFRKQRIAALDRIKYEAFTTYYENRTKFQENFTETCILNVTCYRFKSKDLKMIPVDMNVLNRLQRTDMEKVFSSVATHKLLFPHNRIITSTIPYRLLPSNIGYIITPNSVMLGSCSNTPNHDVIYTNLTNGTHFRCKLGLAYSIDVFGSDVTELQKHVMMHVKNVMELAADKNDVISLCIYSPSNIDRADIDRIMSDINLSRYYDDKMFKNLRIFEKKLE